MLFKQSIDFIELEAGIDPNDHLHVRFEDIKAYLEEKNYFVFGIYEQVQDWVNRKPILRRVNVLFISRRMSSIH